MTEKRTLLRRLVRTAATYAAIVAITLMAVDLLLIALGLFPPRHNYGDPELGWRSASATGRMELGECLEWSTGEQFQYDRNEDGVRTSRSRAAIMADSASFRIAVTGDSQTDLCAPNESIHAGVLESTLRASGIESTVLTFASGRYSPLQGYLAFRQVLRPYNPTVLILNVYTGNDLYDVLRVDDRPHFVATPHGYEIRPPTWFMLDDPTVRYRSRVLFALRSLGDRIGVRKLYLRVSELRRLAAEQDAGLTSVVAYMWDLWRASDPSLGYPAALSAQMLNQQLFFHHFPGSEAESLRRMRALMALIREENPGMVLVLSPIPSYELVGELPVDSALTNTLRRLPVGYGEGKQQEGELYSELRSMAATEGWIFVDNLIALQAGAGGQRLYNGFDYHLLPSGSKLIGSAQAAAISGHLRRTPTIARKPS